MTGMAAMADHAKTTASVDPCCDHGKRHAKTGQDCAASCAVSCVSVAALAPAPIPAPLGVAHPVLRPAPEAWAYAHDPTGLSRPPKAIA
jgi:hypothetical protein